jgi:hypothetical protein
MKDSRIEAIRANYRKAREKTLTLWAGAEDPGEETPLPYHPTKLAYTLGTLFTPPAALRPVIDELREAATGDERISVVGDANLHFTFLALTPHGWDSAAEMPPREAITVAVVKHLRDVEFRLSQLQLLPMANVLLLAGVPSIATLDARDRLIADLMRDEPIVALLKERYGPNFPPIFWHTTLARSRTMLSPTSIRQIYRKHDEMRFGDMTLPHPRFYAASFDWAIRHELR